jgi:hypothetical protein
MALFAAISTGPPPACEPPSRPRNSGSSAAAANSDDTSAAAAGGSDGDGMALSSGDSEPRPCSVVYECTASDMRFCLAAAAEAAAAAGAAEAAAPALERGEDADDDVDEVDEEEDDKESSLWPAEVLALVPISESSCETGEPPPPQPPPRSDSEERVDTVGDAPVDDEGSGAGADRPSYAGELIEI